MKQINKDVKIKSIYEEKDVIKSDYMEGIQAFKEEGEEVKVAKQLPVKMTIIDDKIVLLILKERGNMQNSLMAIIINQSELAKTFKVIFNFFWKQGKDFQFYANK